MKKSGFKSLLKKIRPYAVPGIITGLVMIVILILKGIWPFGSSRIDYFDNMQQVARGFSPMVQCVILFSFHIMTYRFMFQTMVQHFSQCS